MLFFPTVASAHTANAVLLRTDPTINAILSTTPRQVRLWFSEDLKPVLSTAIIFNAEDQRVDNHDAHVSFNDPFEIDLTLKPNLPPDVYAVIWRSDSNQDDQVLHGSFIFTVARPDGTYTTLSGNTIPGQDALGVDNPSGLNKGQIDGPNLFNLIMIILVELGAVFWVGAQLWSVFVLQAASEDHTDQSITNQQVQQRFEQRFSLPTLVILLLANVGVLLGQAIYFTGGQWGAIFTNRTEASPVPSLMISLATIGRFGTFWMMREIVIVIAIVISLYLLITKDRPKLITNILSWANLILGLTLLMAITMSSQAATINVNVVVYTIPIDWLNLLAAAFCAGGLMYIAVVYLPIIRRSLIKEQAHSLTTVLPYYSPWIIVAIVIIAITSPINATFYLASWSQYVTTIYGRTLIVKILLVSALLVTCFLDIGLLRPRVKKEYRKYSYVTGRLNDNQAALGATEKSLAKQVKLRQARLSDNTRRLTGLLRWEPLIGIGVLLCVGLMNVFGNTLSLTTTRLPATGNQQPFNTTVKTTDNKFSIMFIVTPNRSGTNIFTISIVDNITGRPTTNIGVTLNTTMSDMDMGTDTVNLLPDGKGHFTTRGDLSMGGNWQIRILIRTPQGTVSEANVRFFVPV
jgi:copper transport protein